MNVSERLNAVERERNRRCVNCGGALALVSRKRSWREIVDEVEAFTEEDLIAFAAEKGLIDMLPPSWQERASEAGARCGAVIG